MRVAGCSQFFAYHSWRRPGLRSSRRSHGAFTLIELLAVIAIAALLCALSVSVGGHAQETGRRARAAGELASLTAALDSYRARYGDYPRTADAGILLQSLLGRRAPDGTIVDGPVLIDLAGFSTAEGQDLDATTRLCDPWGHPYAYAYRAPAAGWTNPGFVLWSAGPDGETRQLEPSGYPGTTAACSDDLHVLP